MRDCRDKKKWKKRVNAFYPISARFKNQPVDRNNNDSNVTMNFMRFFHKRDNDDKIMSSRRARIYLAVC